MADGKKHRGIEMKNTCVVASERGFPANKTGVSAQDDDEPAIGASSLYRTGLWRMGLAAARRLPLRFVEGVGTVLAELHFRLQPKRRGLGHHNPMSAGGGD